MHFVYFHKTPPEILISLSELSLLTAKIVVAITVLLYCADRVHGDVPGMEELSGYSYHLLNICGLVSSTSLFGIPFRSEHGVVHRIDEWSAFVSGQLTFRKAVFS